MFTVFLHLINGRHDLYFYGPSILSVSHTQFMCATHFVHGFMSAIIYNKKTEYTPRSASVLQTFGFPIFANCRVYYCDLLLRLWSVLAAADDIPP